MSDLTSTPTAATAADTAADTAAQAEAAEPDAAPATPTPRPAAGKLSNAWTGPLGAGAGAAEVAGSEQAAPADTAGLTVVDEDELLSGAADEPEPLSPYDRPGKWFVLHTQSGYEKKVKQNLEARIESMNMEDRIHEVVIPTREVPEFKNGRKVMTEKKLFPGYLLCRTQLDDDAWYAIRNTPGVTGFVNQGGKPSPMRRKDVESFLGVEADRKREATKKSKPMFEFGMGETVRVKEGPFADFSGEIIEINEDQLKVKVLVNIFGRETPVELEFAQVARL